MMAKKPTSPTEVMSRESIMAPNSWDSGAEFVNNVVKTTSRIPTPAGAPGVKKPANQAVTKAPVQNRNESIESKE